MTRRRPWKYINPPRFAFAYAAKVPGFFPHFTCFDEPYINPYRVPRSSAFGNKKQLKKEWRRENFIKQEKHLQDHKLFTSFSKHESQQGKTTEIVVPAREKPKEEKQPTDPTSSKKEQKAAKKKVIQETEEVLEIHKEHVKKEQEKNAKKKEKEEQKRREMEKQGPITLVISVSKGKKHKKSSNSKKENSNDQETNTNSVKSAEPKKQKARKNQQVKTELGNFNPFDEAGVVDDWGDLHYSWRPSPGFIQWESSPPRDASHALPRKRAEKKNTSVRSTKPKDPCTWLLGNNLPQLAPQPKINIWEQRKLDRQRLQTLKDKEQQMLDTALENSKEDVSHNQTVKEDVNLNTVASNESLTRNKEQFQDKRIGASGIHNEFLPDTTTTDNPKIDGALNVLSFQMKDCNVLNQGHFTNATGASVPLNPLASSFEPSVHTHTTEEEYQTVPLPRPPINQLFAIKTCTNNDDNWESDDDVTGTK